MSNLSKTRYNVFAENDEYGFSNDHLIFINSFLSFFTGQLSVSVADPEEEPGRPVPPYF